MVLKEKWKGFEILDLGKGDIIVVKGNIGELIRWRVVFMLIV